MADNLTPAPQSITTIAGNGVAGSAGDGQPAVQAQLNSPTGIAEDLTGSLYISDSGNNKVRKVVMPTTIGQDTISTLAGTGTGGFAGDGGPATQAHLRAPTGVAVDSQGDVFIVDSGNNRVREVTPDGTIRTVAGNGTCGHGRNTGDGGPALNASLCAPTGVAVDGQGQVYVSDTGHSEVRVFTVNGSIQAFAGTGIAGYSGDGGSATAARLNGPTGLAIDATHDVFIADTVNSVVREVNPTGTISTFAGNGHFGYAGDGGPATKAELRGPTGLGVDQSGNVYISDTVNNRLREVNGSGTISTLAGTGVPGFSGDGGPAVQAQLRAPTGNVAAGGSVVYFSDTRNQRVRGVFSGPPPVLPQFAWAIIIPLGAGLVAGVGLVTHRRRRRVVRIS